MKKNINKFSPKEITYTNEPMKMGDIVKDFLPKPEHLVFKEAKTRVTLTLTKKSLDFFKRSAKKHDASYQAMIRQLIDFYVANQNV